MSIVCSPIVTRVDFSPIVPRKLYKIEKEEEEEESFSIFDIKKDVQDYIALKKIKKDEFEKTCKKMFPDDESTYDEDVEEFDEETDL